MKIKIIIRCFFCISLMFKNIDGQIALNRSLLEEWYPDINETLNLDLNSQQIKTIDPKTFNGLTNLQSLNLNYNQLVSIDPATFNGLNLDEL